MNGETTGARLFGWAPVEDGSGRRHAAVELLLLAAVLAIAWATPPLGIDGRPNAPLSAFAAAHLGGGLCLYHRLTGIECPGCGLSRSFVQLAHGQLGGAVALNPIGPVVFALFGWRGLQALARVVAGRRLTLRVPPAIERRLPAMVLTAFVLIGVARIVAAVV